MTAWIEGRVSGQTRWTDRLHSLRVDAPMGRFEAGQFAKLALDIDGERIARPYSFVNPPGDACLEFYYALVAEGPLSPRLAALEAGQRVLLAPNPAGFLVLSEVPDAESLWLICTGTGIGPYLSILRTGTPWTRFRRVVLVHAARYPVELAYGEVLAQISKTHGAQFSCIRIASREPAEGLLCGRIPGLLGAGTLEAAADCALSATGSQVLLCGNPDMVRDVIAVLARRGMKKHRRRNPGQITVENYW